MDTKFVQERITQLRIARNISEYRLSRDLGYSKGYIQSISSGKTLPSITALFEICDYFKISPKEFFDDAVTDSELFCDLMSEIRELSTEEQYSLYHFLIARKKGSPRQP